MIMNDGMNDGIKIINNNNLNNNIKIKIIITLIIDNNK